MSENPETKVHVEELGLHALVSEVRIRRLRSLPYWRFLPGKKLAQQQGRESVGWAIHA